MMPTPKVHLAKRAAALKLRLRKAASVLEQARLDTEQHAREAEELAAELAAQAPAPVQDIPAYCEAEPVEVHPDVKRSLWQRFMDTF